MNNPEQMADIERRAQKYQQPKADKERDILRIWLKDYAGMLGSILGRPLPPGFTSADMDTVRATRDAVKRYVASGELP